MPSLVTRSDLTMGTGKGIPGTAVAIKVTNVASPSLIKIYHEESFTERHNCISRKLQSIMKRKTWKRISARTEPKTGDIAIVQHRPELELPAWWVRGTLGSFNEETSMYNVFLVDHGNTIKAYRKDLSVVPRSLVPDDYLTVTVGLHNVIPAEYSSTASVDGETMKATRKWSDTAVRITRECIAASSRLYFDYRAVGENEEKYGDLYLVLDNEIVSLSEILVRNEFAVYLTKDLLTMMKPQNRDVTKETNAVDGGIVIDVAAAMDESSRKGHATAQPHVRLDDKLCEEMRVTSILKGGKLIRYAGEDCQQILVNSSISCERLTMLADARFPGRIHEALKRLSIIALRRIQTYMWPAVAKGLSVLAVGPPNCGKTIGYVLPIVSCIASWKAVPKGNNPAILILCSSTPDVLSVQSLCSELLECYTDIRSVAGYNGRPNRSFVAEIYNGCQILVATPPFLARFINQDVEHRKLLNFGNLSHLVIDGIDVILDKYYEPLRTLLTRHVIFSKKERRSFDKPPLQIVAVAHKWSSLVSEFARQCMTDPYVCIGSYMEAAVFGRVMPSLCFIQTEKKMDKLTELLGDDASIFKTIIICSHSEEARALDKHVSRTSKTLVACEKMIFTEIHGIRESWKAGVSGLYPILICTDQVLVDLNITDVDWLIHYSVTLPSKTQFYFRFSTLMNNLKKGQGKCKVTVIIDETNDVQLFGVVEVAKRCGTKIRSQFMNKVLRITATLDRKKKMYPICDNVKAFGFCPKKNSCPYRHCVLNGIDTPTTPIEIGDSVKLIVTYVHNATHFTARLMEYIKPGKKVTKYSAEEYTRTSAMMQAYYADKKNRRYRRKDIKVGDIFAVEESLDNFQRVKILNIAEKDYDEVPIAVELKCIDTGAILPRISTTQLMDLPDDFANRDTHIVEVFLAGLSPYDDEYEWNHRAIHDAHSWFPDRTKLHSFVLAKVRLHLGDTLWVDPLEIRTKIIGHPDLVSASLKWHMIRLEHGVANENHLARLYELCKIGMVKNAREEDIVPANFDTLGIDNESDSMLS